ncbi:MULTISPECIES: NAD-dependent epimerase/dehydratase family protein [unclassified Acinetobacter]|uniref:NAD-dependent epimerase/dehydratase family protein n=1 Tax=unclassified Acinetobacter TaxID=196816 RepID=UPI0015D17E6F|nr:MULTISPECIES: NAD-dependent epimerase/dehydratase family protein [unclassified Acinetobacter]
MINYGHSQVKRDLDEIINLDLPFEQLKNKTILITGATGMLASYFGFLLLHLNEHLKLNIQPIFLARNYEKLKAVYGEALSTAYYLVQDVCEPIHFDGEIHYIFHAAGGASPYHIINDPVGVINANVLGTKNILECARTSNTEKVIFTSTREIYGCVEGVNIINESSMGVLDPLNPRDCYPESKRLAESMLQAYYQQYKISFNTLRIAHSYGPGMQIQNDGRVMADLINDAVNNRDIILKSDGTAERAFCYITDVLTAIIYIMIKGAPCKAYNIANELQPISILNLAKMLQKLVNFGNGVSIQLNEYSKVGYTSYERKMLDTNLLQQLGWMPNIPLEQGLIRTLNTLGVFNE